jgi:hypothetical protein
MRQDHAGLAGGPGDVRSGGGRPKAERTLYDLLAGAPSLVADAHGISSVWVGGVDVCRDGVASGAMPGTVLRSGRDTETETVTAS